MWIGKWPLAVVAYFFCEWRFEVLKQINRWAGSEGHAVYGLPRSEVVAVHAMDLIDVGRVGITIMMSDEKRGRYVTVVTVGQRTPIPIVRVHSSCLYGDTLGSLWCDCGEQLRESLRRMKRSDSGILIYLNQEGRGAGLGVKALAHELAERLHLDTHDAYMHLGFETDMRSYADATRVLRLLDVESCILLTNNPAKVKALESDGIIVRPEALATDRTESSHVT